MSHSSLLLFIKIKRKVKQSSRDVRAAWHSIRNNFRRCILSEDLLSHKISRPYVTWRWRRSRLGTSPGSHVLLEAEIKKI